ncbi:hypothetical protein SETIT_4G113300v2 [Setaria italica]|uniref:DUF7595 domain-containing protein n=1 Tax=Setaria italica TaxID=4555 RepID=A0A368QTI8_SETIT|nr:hypothetical protein SETIT_4G113300v2 [Setaria italica]
MGPPPGQGPPPSVTGSTGPKMMGGRNHQRLEKWVARGSKWVEASLQQGAALPPSHLAVSGRENTPGASSLSVRDEVARVRCARGGSRRRRLVLHASTRRRLLLLPPPPGAYRLVLLPFVPAPGSALGRRRRFLTSFVRDDAGLLENAKPLAERDGLVLLRASPHAAGQQLFSLCVCSLLTGKLDVLPPLDMACFHDEGMLGYAILTSANQDDVPADGYSNLCQNWSTAPAICFPSGLELFAGPYGRAAAVCCDTAHWLFEDYRLPYTWSKLVYR